VGEAGLLEIARCRCERCQVFCSCSPVRVGRPLRLGRRLPGDQSCSGSRADWPRPSYGVTAAAAGQQHCGERQRSGQEDQANTERTFVHRLDSPAIQKGSQAGARDGLTTNTPRSTRPCEPAVDHQVSETASSRIRLVLTAPKHTGTPHSTVHRSEQNSNVCVSFSRLSP